MYSYAQANPPKIAGVARLGSKDGHGSKHYTRLRVPIRRPPSHAPSTTHSFPFPLFAAPSSSDMARSRSEEHDDVVADSEEEARSHPQPQPQPAKKTVRPSEDEEMADADEEEGEGDSEEGESEYEIEAILGHKMGMFTPGEYAYYVSWKGYPAEENSWVSQDDAGNAMELITEYWKTRPKREVPQKSSSAKKRGSSVSKRDSSVSKRDSSVSKREASVKRESSAGRGRKSTTRIASDDSDIEVLDKGEEKTSVTRRRSVVTSPKTTGTAASVNDVVSDDDDKLVKKAKANGKLIRSAKKAKEEKEDEESETHVGTAVDADDDYPALPDMSPYMHQLNWEQLVTSVDTIEQHGDGTLRVFLTLDNGQRSSHDMSVVRQRCPQKLITFFEGHLRWRQPRA
ncbi:hypothetical protein CALCODRAFT_370405 [Calocera cornea HHB12733]|uniref:Chromo domain-containing protein n=1 Tax=Calocera cornea HHB12733 TaxID=1353952 RepID=A0A165EIL3_9BASI|nr:hypothetical protein CALCODRAFT_370405 [Calocera cornea HHB12733]